MVANGEGKDGFILLSRGYLESHQMAFQQYRKYSFDHYTLIFIHANCSCKALGPATNDSKPPKFAIQVECPICKSGLYCIIDSQSNSKS